LAAPVLDFEVVGIRRSDFVAPLLSWQDSQAVTFFQWEQVLRALRTSKQSAEIFKLLY
jgi:hypothetical protein